MVALRWTLVTPGLYLSPLRLSDAGDYSCNVTSTLLNSPVAASNSQRVIIKSKRVQLLYIA